MLKSSVPDSDRRSSEWRSDALPTELTLHKMFVFITVNETDYLRLAKSLSIQIKGRDLLRYVEVRPTYKFGAGSQIRTDASYDSGYKSDGVDHCPIPADIKDHSCLILYIIKDHSCLILYKNMKTT